MNSAACCRPSTKGSLKSIIAAQGIARVVTGFSSAYSAALPDIKLEGIDATLSASVFAYTAGIMGAILARLSINSGRIPCFSSFSFETLSNDALCLGDNESRELTRSIAACCPGVNAILSSPLQ